MLLIPQQGRNSISPHYTFDVQCLSNLSGRFGDYGLPHYSFHNAVASSQQLWYFGLFDVQYLPRDLGLNGGLTNQILPFVNSKGPSLLDPFLRCLRRVATSFAF